VVQGTEAVDVAEVPVDIRQGMEGFRLAQRHLDELWRLVLPPRRGCSRPRARPPA
jgi:hypothetical protein